MTDQNLIRERLALKLAPWLAERYEPEWDEALRTLTQMAYGNPDTAWSSPRVLVRSALDEAMSLGRRT